ncbi:nucleoside hydrolase [Lichenihabitans sp. Uapishka_5]|uniref:nucleoside hydrolase n=1 Tax=Lichenihabitans sp. Uapishka_5 TaxID=3037302 RepID=UPI0029E7F19E|nr:nucleoside hydrolase [Lichenihabitans sp. Uapishka_5]MDX7949876.1 nucleoside hydrolase [Lichenihabitans sp. Uapishka_5]
MARKIIIDTDPGQDDAVAILLALASPEDVQVLGITTVGGNVPLWRTTENALKISALAGYPELPVYPGCARPMLRLPVTAEHVHGETGLNGCELPTPTAKPQAQHGVDFIIETIRSEPEKSVTICTLGPLTNLAMALVKAPDIAPRIDAVVSMGGAYFEVGNITPAAEFNIYVDPEAAAVVLGSGIPVTLLPLDVTHRVLSTVARLDRIAAIGNKAGGAVAALLGFSERFDLEKYGWAGAPLHDPNVIAYLIAPDLYQGRHINVSIETASPLTLGMTVADYWRVTDRAANCTYIREADADRFYDLLVERLSRLP